MLYEIPVFGPPLAGKSSFLLSAASAAGTHGRVVDSRLKTPDVFENAKARLLEVRLKFRSDTIRLWCMPGGCSPEWPLQFVSQPSAALFVADAQDAMHQQNDEFWQAAKHLVRLDLWFVVLSKCDLARREQQDQAVPSVLSTRPRIRIGGHRTHEVGESALAFLNRTVFPALVSGG